MRSPSRLLRLATPLVVFAALYLVLARSGPDEGSAAPPSGAELKLSAASDLAEVRGGGSLAL